MGGRFWLASAALVCGFGVFAVATFRDPVRPGWPEQREDMVRQQVVTRGVHDPLVLTAMRTVPRHLFLDELHRQQAYQDAAVSIGYGESTPQPYLVALMAELLEVEGGDRVLEIGTGSGYQSAVLAAMGVEVFSVEIRPQLCERAARTLGDLGFARVQVRCGDGTAGWAEEAPFDGILVTAAGDSVPEPLFEQLAVGGRMVIPLGEAVLKDLKVVTRTESGYEQHSVLPVSFDHLESEPRVRTERTPQS